jgi:hypothetical protein
MHAYVYAFQQVFESHRILHACADPVHNVSMLDRNDVSSPMMSFIGYIKDIFMMEPRSLVGSSLLGGCFHGEIVVDPRS